MTRDSLFLHTVDDLDERLQLGRGEYDALNIAWLLRKLLLGGQRSLVDIICNERDLTTPTLAVMEREPILELVGWYPLIPTEGHPVTTLKLREFLRYPALRVRLGEDVSTSRDISVAQLIAFLANNEGAVHVTPPNEAWEKALWEYCWGASYITPDGQYSGGVFCLIEVARVAREGLEPMRAEIAAAVDGNVIPEGLRGSLRVRDPQNYGWPTRT